jgi:asparagine synthase (glutamine-hydrolysing)
MCGFVGYWSKSKANTQIATYMAQRIRNRGPDDAGIYLDNTSELVMAHRRLAIIDLSSAGHQPMFSSCGRFVLVYNGEIYNHMALRRELDYENAAIKWKGHSDTESLLAGISTWGLEKTLEKLNGMFAFALWDQLEKELFLVRDRMGEKPVYYGINGASFFFGSELKAFTAHPDWNGSINRDALALYLRHNYIPSPWSIYNGIYKLSPAHYIAIRQRGRSISKPHCYWNIGKIAEKGATLQTNTNIIELTNELDALLRNSVDLRMMSDVPLGAFLSGGYDSTIVVSNMQALSRKPIKTFTIGFVENTHNEAKYAKAVSDFLGTEHTELFVTPKQTLDVIPKLPEIWDEPFSDSSQIPTFLISQLARQHVTVCLSGDGGDELFCGYNRYKLGQNIWRTINHIPVANRKIIQRIIRKLSPSHPGRTDEKTHYGRKLNLIRDRLLKLADLMEYDNGMDIYHVLVSHWKSPSDIVIDAKEPRTVFNQHKNLPNLPTLIERMMFLDAKTYLPDDILVKLDRASMSVSLETRVPLLDHRLFEFTVKVPIGFKLRSSQSKWILRQVLYRYIPKELVDRPKQGFGIPIEHWLRGPLIDWADNLLNEKKLREQGYFNSKPIRKIWKEHRQGHRRWHYYLWDILMFQAWLAHNSGV